MREIHTKINVLIIPILCLGLMLLPTEIRTHLYLDINESQRGEYWRILSGHFVHISWTHYLMNIAGIVLLGLIYPSFFGSYRWLISTLIIAVFVSFALVLFSKELEWYIGFSGVLSGLFAVAAIVDFQNNRVMNTAILLSLTLYIVFQLYRGELVAGSIEEIATSSYAHFFGLLGGFAWGLFTKQLPDTTTIHNKP